jgi:ankyrin repeat protein
MGLTNSKNSEELINASYYGSIDVVKKLLKEGYNPNFCYYNTDDFNKDGFTALIEASLYGHVKVIRILLKYGADPNIQNNRKDTALTLASWNGHIGSVKELLKNKNININIQNDYKETALLIASRKGNKKIVKLLLKANADTKIRNNYENSALICASLNGYDKISNILTKYIILVPFYSKQFKRINKDIIRESIFYFKNVEK